MPKSIATDDRDSTPSLYGLDASSRKNKHHWTKNCFNSSFPMSLCCWLRDRGEPVLFIKARGGGAVEVDDLSVADLFNLPEGKTPYFAFEKPYEPYLRHCAGGENPSSDVVIHVNENGRPGKPCRALEVKLTVVPDSTTGKGKAAAWAPEIVFRPATLGTATLGLYTSLEPQKARLKEVLRPVFTKFKAWASSVEAKINTPAALAGLQTVIDEMHSVQQPLIVQPIWRTTGSYMLDENAFDVFVWSDIAFLQLVVDVAQPRVSANAQDSGGGEVKRQQRAALQMLRTLYVLATSNEVNLEELRGDMGYGKQSDKAFSVAGNITRKYLDHPRLLKPAIPRAALRELFLGDGRELLQPERRLDATIYFTWKQMFPA